METERQRDKEKEKERGMERETERQTDRGRWIETGQREGKRQNGRKREHAS